MTNSIMAATLETVNFALKQATLLILKPDVVSSQLEDEVLKKLRGWDIEVLERKTQTLSEADISLLYAKHTDKPYYADLVKYMSSGPSTILVISDSKGIGYGIAERFNDLIIGPSIVEFAQEVAPHSLRAIFGTEEYKNGIHASSDYEAAAREISLFFPEFVAPKVPQPKMERTVALIRPEAFKHHMTQIWWEMKEAGFREVTSKQWHFTDEEARKFYKTHEGKAYFEELITTMTSGPCLVLLVDNWNGISKWRQLLGRGKTAAEAMELEHYSLRARYPIDGGANCAHGASGAEEAQHDIEYFFSPLQAVLCVRSQASEEKEKIIGMLKYNFPVTMVAELVLNPEDATEFYGKEELAGSTVTIVVLELPDAIQTMQCFVESNSLQQAAYVVTNEEKAKAYIERVSSVGNTVKNSST